MMQMVFLAVLYMGVLALFAFYAFLNVKQTKLIEQWNEKTDLEIRVLKERNLELEKRIGKMEHDLGMAVIEPEPDFVPNVNGGRR